MSDLGKAIRGLELCGYQEGMPQCDSCPYDGKDCWARLKRDALSLLKAQEPILLENQHKPYGISTNTNSPWISRCPRCWKKVEGKQTRYCKYCGQAVKWE
jgi:hypothetical protein